MAVQRPRWKSVSSFARSVSPTHCGAHHGFMASFSSSASMPDKPPLQSIWRGEGARRPKGGRHSFIITPTASRRWTYSWFRQSHSDCSTGCCHDRRQILWLGVTAHPTAEWISHQLTETYGWKVAPRYIIRDRDAVYGDVFIRRLRAMSIRDRPTAPRSPWQNRHLEKASVPTRGY